MKKILKYIITFISMIIIFCILLTVTSLIPREALTKKVSESAEILKEQTNDFFIYINGRKTKFDNYTDTLMINTAYSIDNTTPFYSSMMARKNYIKGKTEIIFPDEAGELKSASKYRKLNQVGDLIDTLNNDTVESFEYARYWHGYLIILRPLLLILNITQIRFLLLGIFAILAIILLYKLYKKIDFGTAIIFLCGFLMCDYFYIGMTLQSTSVFLIMMIASIIIISKDIKDKCMFFMIIGGLTSFFDFLTVPILTLGLPLLIYVLMKIKDNFNFKNLLIELIKYCIMWGIGYIGIWFIKWLIVDIVYNKGLIQVAINQILYRSEKLYYSVSELISVNIIITIIPLIISFLATIILLVIKLTKMKNLKLNLKGIAIILFIGLIDLAWIFVSKQHYSQHLMFTYRNNLLISTCIWLIIYNIFTIKEEDVKEITDGKSKNSNINTML